MKTSTLARSLLLGFLPILIFIVVEEIYGTVAGIVAAIALGIVEIAVIYLKEKRFDRLVLFDIGLVAALGGISLLFANEIFFKLKPALFEFFFCGMMALSLWGRVPLIQMMMQRQMRGTGLAVAPDNPAIIKMLTVLFFLFLFHGALTAWAAVYATSAAWGFISGPLLYILFGLMFLVQFVKMKIRRPSATSSGLRPPSP